MPEAPAMLQSGSNESTSNHGDSGKENKKPAPGGHNAVEQKYRRGINDSLIMLREIVPALGHLRAAPGAEPNKRKLSQFSLAAAATPAAPAAYVDGVPAPKKLSKQLILVTATDYIRYLKSRRDELESEVASLKSALNDCVEDSRVVFDVHEQRWAPERAKILEDRQLIYADREQAKESSKKRAKTDKDDGQAGSGENKTSDAEDDSDDDDEDMAEAVVATAIAAKGQPKSRGKAAKKAASSASKTGPTVARPSAWQQQQQVANGPPRALMSVFAGVSFIGGAGYDMIYGATGAQQTTNPEAPRVWSQGLVKRSNAGFAESVDNVTATAMHPMQTFFIERPALLSGLVMVSISLSIAYTAFYILPAIWSRLSGSSQEQKRQEAREVLIQAARPSSSISAHQQRAALARLAGSPSSTTSQMARLPTLALAATWSYLFGSSPTYFASKAQPGDLEEVASAVRLLEQDFGAGRRIALLVSFSSLYVKVHSDWPQTTDSLPLLARAEALLALVLAGSTTKLARSAATKLWTSAQIRLKKDASQPSRPVWLGAALSMRLDEARSVVASINSSISPLYQAAASQSQSMLLQAWTALFTDVVDITVSPSMEDKDGAATPKASQAVQPGENSSSQVDEVLAIMPAQSPLATYALLLKAVQAVGRNDTVTAFKAAHVLAAKSDKMASVAAFLSLVRGQKLSDGPTEYESPLDRLAYATVAWLCVRQIATASKDGAGVTDNHLQSLTIKLRRLLASEPFSSKDANDAFIDAQERCVESLVKIGRKASGLEALDDSGCEL